MIWKPVALSSPVVGSSSMRMSELKTSSMAIDSRFLCPLLQWAA